MKGLRALLERQVFDPGLIGIFINPFYAARAGLRDAMRHWAPELRGHLLDVGCGTKPYQRYFKMESYVGLELDTAGARQRGIADYYYDGQHFPFSDAAFDAVLCNQVLEHVFQPDIFLGEIFRVLRPGGKLLLTVPFVWDEHEQPYDYARYSSFGLRALMEKQGFSIIQQQKLGANAALLCQLANAYLYKVARPAPKPIRWLLQLSLMAGFNLLGLLLKYVLPGNPDLFLDQVVLAEKRR